MLEIPYFMRDNPNMNDPLSDVLRLVSAHSVVSGGLVAGGSWAISFPAVGTINFFGILRGSCWLIDQDQPPQRIAAGDIFLRSAHRQLVLCSDLEVFSEQLGSAGWYAPVNDTKAWSEAIDRAFSASSQAINAEQYRMLAPDEAWSSFSQAARALFS